MPTTLLPGQSVVLTAQPTIGGNPGGAFPGPVNWSNNANLININPTMTPSADTLSCTVSIPANTTNYGSFSAFANSGNLSASIVLVVAQPADGMQIVAGNPF
jgi:hypothetical protein